MYWERSAQTWQCADVWWILDLPQSVSVFCEVAEVSRAVKRKTKHLSHSQSSRCWSTETQFEVSLHMHLSHHF